MEKSERLELIATLVESEKTDAEIKEYFRETLNLELSDSTLYRDIKQVRDSIAPPPEDTQSPPPPTEEPNENDGDQGDENENEGDKDEEESTEKDAELSEEEKKAEEEATIEALIEAIKEDRAEELLESAQKEFDPINFINFKRLLNVAKGRVELEVSKQKAEEARKERKKFVSDLGKNVNPAIKSMEKAQKEIANAIKFKRKQGKNVRALVGVSKVLTRQIKVLERQIDG